MKKIKALSYSLICNVLAPVLFFSPLIAIIFSLDGMDTQCFSGKSTESIWTVLLVGSMILSFVASVNLGKVSVGNDVLFSLSFGSRTYNFTKAGGRYYIEEEGTSGLAAIVVNFLKCLIIMPIRLIFGIIKLPLILFSDDYCDELEDYFQSELEHSLLGYGLLILALILCLPSTISRSNELSKYNLDNIHINCVELRNDGVRETYLKQFNQYVLVLSVEQDNTYIRDYAGRFEVYLNDEMIASINCEYYDFEMAPGVATQYYDVNGVKVEYSFELNSEYGDLAAFAQGADCKVEVIYKLDSIHYENTEIPSIGYDFNEANGKPGPQFVLFSNSAS